MTQTMITKSCKSCYNELIETGSDIVDLLGNGDVLVEVDRVGDDYLIQVYDIVDSIEDCSFDHE